MVISKQIKE